MNAAFPNILGFRLISELGTGGMATVYQAIQLSLEPEAAFKVMYPALAVGKNLSERFAKEVKTTLTHYYLKEDNEINISQLE